jgi:hypothetical protein
VSECRCYTASALVRLKCARACTSACVRARAGARVCVRASGVDGQVCVYVCECTFDCPCALRVRGAVTICGATLPLNGGQGGSCAGHVHVAQDEAGRARRAQVVGGAVYWAG